MKCFHCGKEMNELHMKLISADGDFVCDATCESEYNKEKDHFLNEVIQDDEKFATWLGVGSAYYT